jgi:hypothetical protein
MWKLSPFIFLFGCPVVPTDVQDVQEQQLPKQGNNMPPANGAQTPNGQGNNQGQQGQMGQQGEMQAGTQGQQGIQQNQEGMEGGLLNDANNSGMPQEMTQNIDDPNMAQNPTAAQDVLPIYEDPPAFDQLIEAGNAVTIDIKVKGADSYNMEFVIAQEGSGRLAPKVVHIEKAKSEDTQILAPSNFPNPVWLIITADVGANGPTKDDLFAGSKEPITIGSENLTLEYTLENDDAWMESLPWFSRIDNPASKKNGEPIEGENTADPIEGEGN